MEHSVSVFPKFSTTDTFFLHLQPLCRDRFSESLSTAHGLIYLPTNPRLYHTIFSVKLRPQRHYGCVSISFLAPWVMEQFMVYTS